MPRYRPNIQNSTACRGMPSTIVFHIEGRNSGGTSRLNRSQNASPQASADAATSCKNARNARWLNSAGFKGGLSRTAPCRVHGHREAYVHHREGKQDDQLRVYRLTERPERRGAADEHERVFGQGRPAVSPTHLHQPLVVVAAVRVPESFAAQDGPGERHARTD